MTDESKAKLAAILRDTLKTVGLPGVLLCALGFALWQALVWGGTNIMLPLVNKQIESLAKVDASQDMITRTQERMVDRMDKIGKEVEENRKVMQDVSLRHDKSFEEIVRALQQINASIKEENKQK